MKFKIGDKVKLYNKTVGFILSYHFSDVVNEKLYTIKCVNGDKIIRIENDFELISTSILPEELFNIWDMIQ